MSELVAALNRLYRDHPALHVDDCDPRGFRWIVADDHAQSALVWTRHADGHPPVLVAFNLTPIVRESYRIGIDEGDAWTELLTTDDTRFGGSGVGTGPVVVEDVASHGRARSIVLTLPPLAAIFLTPT